MVGGLHDVKRCIHITPLHLNVSNIKVFQLWAATPKRGGVHSDHWNRHGTLLQELAWDLTCAEYLCSHHTHRALNIPSWHN